MDKNDGSYIKTRAEFESKKLFRSANDRLIAGIAGGLGNYFDIDSNVIRLIFIFLTFFGGSGIILYLILWLIIPAENTTTPSEQRVNENMEEMKNKAQQFTGDSRFLLGLIILLVGFALLLSNFGIFNFFDLFKFWPLLLIALGLAVLFRR